MNRCSLPERLARACLLIILFAASAVLTARIFAGPIPAIISARSTLNFAAVAFLSFLYLVAIAGRAELAVTTKFFKLAFLSQPVQYLLLTVAVIAAYANSLDSQFLFDDYVYLTNANAETLPRGFFNAL